MLPALVFIVVMGLSILVIFGFDALARQRVDIVPVALVGSVVAIATILIGTCLTPPQPSMSHLAAPGRSR